MASSSGSRKEAGAANRSAHGLPCASYGIPAERSAGEQCKEEDFDLYDMRWVLKYKKNPEYIQFLMKAILEYKEEIFVYIQQYYRYFMKRKSVEQLPEFNLH